MVQEVKKISNSTKVLVLALFGLVSVIIGFILTPSVTDVVNGIKAMAVHHGLTDTCAFFVASNNGAPYVQNGIFVWIILLIFKATKTEIKAGPLAGILMVYGYAFYGKTLFNFWPLMLGCYLHAYVNKKELSSVSPLACYSTALGPLVSVLAFNKPIFGEAGSMPNIINAFIIGILAGYLIGFLSGHIAKLHDGNILYTGGFTAGVVGFLFNSIFKSIGFGHDPYGDPPYVSQDHRLVIMGIMAILFIYFIVAGLAVNKGKGNAKDLLTDLRESGDFVNDYGFGSTLINVGFLGMITVGYFFLMPYSEAHGIMYAATYTVAAFAACGMTIRSIAPFLLGAFLGAFGTGAIGAGLVGKDIIEGGLIKASSRSMINAAFVGCGLSPITYRYGSRATVAGGILHMILVPNVSVLHGWTSVYNNGWGVGLLVTLFLPIVQAFRTKERNEVPK